MLHFKPSVNDGASPSCLFLLFFFDFLFSLTFQMAHIYFFLMQEFSDENNHMLHVLIGAGFIGIILFYSFTDGIRFLRSNIDKFLYMVCCLLQKPILFPVMFPSRFRSRIATKHISTHTVTLTRIELIEGKQKEVQLKILPTNFLLAV